MRTILIVAALLLAGCASPTVAEMQGRSTTNAAQQRLTPDGLTDVLADARKRVAESLEGRAGFTPPSGSVAGWHSAASSAPTTSMCCTSPS